MESSGRLARKIELCCTHATSSHEFANHNHGPMRRRPSCHVVRGVLPSANPKWLNSPKDVRQRQPRKRKPVAVRCRLRHLRGPCGHGTHSTSGGFSASSPLDVFESGVRCASLSGQLEGACNLLDSLLGSGQGLERHWMRRIELSLLMNSRTDAELWLKKSEGFMSDSTSSRACHHCSECEARLHVLQASIDRFRPSSDNPEFGAVPYGESVVFVSASWFWICISSRWLVRQEVHRVEACANGTPQSSLCCSAKK